jgi:hypothetical protein
VATGFADLDRLTGGLRAGQFIVVAGRPGMGKSVVGVDIARAVALREKKPVAFFSLEMARRSWSPASWPPRPGCRCTSSTPATSATSTGRSLEVAETPPRARRRCTSTPAPT